MTSAKISGKDIRQHLGKFKDSVQSGLNCLQQAVQQQQQQQQQRLHRHRHHHHHRHHNNNNNNNNNNSNNSHSHPSDQQPQETTMCGWLRKMGGGVLKAWQRRWFVVKGDCMYCYLSPGDPRPPQGTVFLPGSRVVERPFRPNDSEKFVFDIVQVSVEGQSRTSNQEIISLSAPSEEERTEWIRSIRRILYGSIGGAIFGRPLEDILRFERLKDASIKVPQIVQACVDYIRENGIEEEGIFRMTGRTSVIKGFCEAYDCGLRPSMENFEDMDVHSASSVLKLYLRELPSPLVPFDHYETFVRIVTRELPICAKEAMASLRSALVGLPQPNLDLLRYLCRFLHAVGKRHDVNKMTFSNLATVFSTAFVRPEPEKDACLLMATASSRKAVTQILIEHQEWLFDGGGGAFDSVILVAELLGLEGDLLVTALGETLVRGDFELKKKSSKMENVSEVVMRKSLLVKQSSLDSDVVKQSNRKWVRVMKKDDSLEEIYCRWHTSLEETLQEGAVDKKLDEQLDEKFNKRVVKRVNEQQVYEEVIDDEDDEEEQMSHVAGHPVESFDPTEEETYESFSSDASSNSSTRSRAKFPIVLIDEEIEDVESLTEFLRRFGVDRLTKGELKRIVELLVGHIQKQTPVTEGLKEREPAL